MISRDAAQGRRDAAPLRPYVAPSLSGELAGWVSPPAGNEINLVRRMVGLKNQGNHGSDRCLSP